MFSSSSRSSGDVPLAIAQRIHRAALNILTVHSEHQIEGAICGDDAQVLIEDEEGLANGIHNRPGEFVSIMDVDEQLAIVQAQYFGCKWVP